MPLDAACVDHIQITVPKALEAECVALYRQSLGSPEIPRPQELQGRSSAWFQVGEHHVGIDPEASPESRRHIGFLVAGVTAARREVLAQGICLEEEDVADGRSRFFIRDPAGNRIEIGQRA
jgi:catechol 2,3-dioxygenase-like lactoylglutathione lyase family enzyme